VQNQKLKKTLCKFPELKLAILFGSFATEQQHQESDIDIAVASDAVLAPERKMQIIEAIAQLTKRSVDLVDLQMKQEPIFSQAITKGKVILCHDRNFYAEFIKQVMYNAADFMPLRARILSERRKAWINS